jgi:hypothetical protein
MIEDVVAVATGVRQRVGQDWHARESALLVTSKSISVFDDTRLVPATHLFTHRNGVRSFFNAPPS